MPETGGEYVYLRETYGPLVGFLPGWTTLLVVQAGGMAAVAIVFARNLDVLLGGGLSQPAIVVTVLAMLAGINCLGVKAGDGVQAALGALKFAAIAVLIVAGLFIAPYAPHALPAVDAARAPEANLVKSFSAALIPVVFSYGGWQTANYVAGEMKDGQRNLARALLVGVLTVVALYLLVNIACLRALGIAGLAHDLTPAADVLRLVAGPLGGKLAAAAVALSAVGFVSQSMLTGPRVYFAMARDGLFFRQAAAISQGSRAPVVAIILQAIWTGVLALSGSYDQILSYVTSMNFLFFGVSASCVFVLRRRERVSGVALSRGFRAPLFPWTVGLFILACAAVVAASFWINPVNSLVGYALMACWASRPISTGDAPKRTSLPRHEPAVIDPRNLKSEYMNFAKFGTAARYNIASSGVKDALLSDLDLRWDDLALHGPNAGGYRPLMERIAARFGVDVAHVVMPGGGCSFANHLAMAAMVAPGARVLVEDPTYELLIDALGYLRADVRRFLDASRRRPGVSTLTGWRRR